jgi:hypothetical protein
MIMKLKNHLENQKGFNGISNLRNKRGECALIEELFVAGRMKWHKSANFVMDSSRL